MISSRTRILLSRSIQSSSSNSILQPTSRQLRSIRPSPTLPRTNRRFPSLLHPSISTSTSSSYLQSSSFHSSSTSRDAPRSPFTVFVETLKEELRKSQEMQDNVKTLQGEAGKLQDSETMRRMKEAYERARITTSIKENPRLMKAAQQLKEGGGKVSDAVGYTLKQMEESEIGRALGAMTSRLARDLSSATAPVRNTEAYKAFTQTLTDAFDDGGSSLRIFTDEDMDATAARKLKRDLRLKKIGRLPPSEDAETAGVVMTKAEEDLANAGDDVDLSDMDIEAIKRAAEAGARKGREDAERSRKEMGEEPLENDKNEEGNESETKSETKSSTSTKPSKPLGYAVRTRSLANDQAGSALVLRPEPAYKQAWSSFSENNSFFRKLGSLREAYDESENPFVERVRGITETIGGWFEQNETSKVIQSFKILDPSFSLESFQKDLREYIIPEVIDSYHGAVRPLLRQWCGEATFNVLMATVDPYLQRGYTINGRLLDVRNIDIVQGRMLENDVPVLVVSFSSQELLYFKDPKNGETVAGKDSQAELCRYALVMTRVENELGNEITGGWKIMELARRGQSAFL